MDEWEYMAMADATEADARSNSGFNQTILAWYQEPAGKVIPEVGNTVENYWGVFDLHGLVWEWVLDFNAVMISGESRNDTALDRNLYCAGSVLGATDPSNYAAFMRYAFRGSLEANYALKNLGFRCALSIDQENQ
jgi:formylglycine-generating enzyme required for sulfatase activity